MLKYSDIKDLEQKTLEAKVSEKRKEIFNLKMQKHTSGLEKSHEFKNAKKEVAKLLTALNQKN